MLVTVGNSPEEVREAGYGTENILRVQQAIRRKEMPPSYDPTEESLTAPLPGGDNTKQTAASVKGNGHKPTPPTTTVEHAVIASIRPRDAVVFSSLLWQAKQAAIQVFHWPADMTDSQFLDKWLKKSFAAYGVHIGDYWVEPRGSMVVQTDTEQED